MVVEGVARSLDCVVDRHRQSNTTTTPTARATTTTFATLYRHGLVRVTQIYKALYVGWDRGLVSLQKLFLPEQEFSFTVCIIITIYMLFLFQLYKFLFDFDLV